MKCSPFMELEDSSPCSQQPTTGRYPESIESSRYSHILFKIHLNIIFPLQRSSPKMPIKLRTNVIILINVNARKHLYLSLNILSDWSSKLELHDELHFRHVSDKQQGNRILWYPRTETGPIQVILVRQKWTKYGSRERVCWASMCLSRIPVN
jgi:hypothetical protein